MPFPELPEFEVRATDLGGRIASLSTKTSEFETPALLPVIHPVRQLVPCKEIKSMGYDAVMTNAYTTFKRLFDRADEGIHRLIDYDGTIMTDSGGYQVLEFGSVDISPIEMAKFEERIGSDIAIILDKPTGLDVTKAFARNTVEKTLAAARETGKAISKKGVIWTLPVQGGKYIDLVSRSSKASAKLPFGCYALGSPVEVMEEYDFALLVRMIVASKRNLPTGRPFHLFGAGHPLIIPLAVALGCDMFDSASYMLYAKADRYIGSSGTVRLEKLEYLGCECRVCSALKASELKMLGKQERTIALAKHNLYALKKVIEETKQAIWEGRLWEYVRAVSSNHPKAFEAFRLSSSLAEDIFEVGTQRFKERGIFLLDSLDLARPEAKKVKANLGNLTFRGKEILLIVPETKKKPFLTSDFFHELSRIIDLQKVLVCCLVPEYGLVPAEVSDIFPISQTTSSLQGMFQDGKKDSVLHKKSWKEIHALFTRSSSPEESWLERELGMKGRNGRKKSLVIARNYKDFKRKIATRV